MPRSGPTISHAYWGCGSHSGSSELRNQARRSRLSLRQFQRPAALAVGCRLTSGGAFSTGRCSSICLRPLMVNLFKEPRVVLSIDRYNPAPYLAREATTSCTSSRGQACVLRSGSAWQWRCCCHSDLPTRTPSPPTILCASTRLTSGPITASISEKDWSLPLPTDRPSIRNYASVRIAGMELPAHAIKEGYFELVDLTLLSIDEQKLPIYLQMRRLSLCDNRRGPENRSSSQFPRAQRAPILCCRVASR